MLSSNQEYIQALRSKEYLLFLEWPEFLIRHYKIPSDKQTADDLVNVVAFYWLKEGFERNDLKLLALLARISEEKPNFFQGKMAYALTTLVMSGILSGALQNFFVKCDAELSSVDEISKYMDSHAVSLTPQEEVLNSFMRSVFPLEILEAYTKMQKPVELRNLVRDYLDYLKSMKEPDEMQGQRLSVLAQLSLELDQQTSIDNHCQAALNCCVEDLKRLGASEYEQVVYLNKLSTPKAEDNVLQAIVQAGFAFFKVLNLADEQQAALAEKPKAANFI